MRTYYAIKFLGISKSHYHNRSDNPTTREINKSFEKAWSPAPSYIRFFEVDREGVHGPCLRYSQALETDIINATVYTDVRRAVKGLRYLKKTYPNELQFKLIKFNVCNEEEVEKEELKEAGINCQTI